MIWIYLSALIFGGVFTIPMVLGGLDFDGDVDFDFDADGDLALDTGDFDAGGDIDVSETNTGGIDTGGAISDFVGTLLSFRSIVFALTFFGLTGIVFNLFDYSEPFPLLMAAGLGFVAAALNAQLFSMLGRGESDSRLSNRDIEGKPATVVLPLNEDRKGRIRVPIRGETIYMVALPWDKANRPYAVGESVVVVEIEDGTALVAPLPGLELGEES
ncbi:MAG: NfeD family protein [Acidimicrobiales bacterium]|nr:NfeD family protein [Acidimicrobiales bacterium]